MAPAYYRLTGYANMDVVEPILRSRADADCAKCLICHRPICTDDDKEYVYRDDKLVGAMHASHHAEDTLYAAS